MKIWDINDIKCMDTLRGHEERVTSAAWHPDAFNSTVDRQSGLLATTSAGHVCNVYKCQLNDNSPTSSNSNNNNGSSNKNSSYISSTDMNTDNNNNTSSSSSLILKFTGHQGGISNCEFHPSGRLLGKLLQNKDICIFFKTTTYNA